MKNFNQNSKSLLSSFTDVLGDEIPNSQPMSLSSSNPEYEPEFSVHPGTPKSNRPLKFTGRYGDFRCVEEIDPKYRSVFSYPYFNLVQSRVIDDALYSDKSMVVCAPTGSGKTVIFEMAIVQLLMEFEDKNYKEDFKIIYMAPVKALCTERLTEWYPKFTRLGLTCIEVTGDTDVDFSQLKPYRIIITTPEKWDMLTRRWKDHRGLVEIIKLFLIDEVHILNDDSRGPVLEAVVSRMKTIESSAQSAHRIERLQEQYQNGQNKAQKDDEPPGIRFVAVSATVSNPEDVASWLGNDNKPAVYYKFGDECRPVKLKRVVEGYPCPDGTSIFKFDIILNYKLWPIIQKYYDGKPTLIFCNTRKSVILTAETLSREITITFNSEQQAILTNLASTIKNKKIQSLLLNGVGCHHAGLLYEERLNIEQAFRNKDIPILITTTTLAMGVNLPAHLVIIKNTQQYVNGAYQEYSISTVLQMVGRAGRPQYDTEATAVIMTKARDKPRYQALVGGSEPLQSYLHKRLPENLNSEAALGTVGDVAQCVQWLRSTFLYVRAAKDPKRYLGLPPAAPAHLISKKIEELCVKAMSGLASSGLITMDEASCIDSTEAGRLMSIYYLDLETMKYIMKIDGTESLERLLWIVCESHELADMHLRVDERRCLNSLNRNSAAATIRFPMKGKISTRQMKLNCIIQAVLGCLPIPDPSLNQEANKILRTAERICKCLVAYVTRPDLISQQPKYFSAVLNSILLNKCIKAHLWENSPYVSKQLRGIGPTFSTLLATAGKKNFLLLEESHPRDLERIMNKGPPAGNILRKQISLVPKYQLAIRRINETTVSIQLVLMNQSYLSENIDQLTAGVNHKCYIVVGDSENHLLLLITFKDKDLINLYDGTITHEITRKHSFEHKIFTHCVSSNFVGLDVHDEYTFNDLQPFVPHNITNVFANNDFCKISQIPQTDIIKDHKKYNTNDVTQSKEKKKRESALIQKIKTLKESFGKTTKEFKKDMNGTVEMSNEILQKLLHTDKHLSRNEYETETRGENIQNQSEGVLELSLPEVSVKNEDNDEFVDDDRIESILHKIEREITGNNNKTSTILHNKYSKCFPLNTEDYMEPKKEKRNSVFIHDLNKNYKKTRQDTIKCKKISKKSNYNFIEKLENTIDLCDKEKDCINKENTFSDSIKNQIAKYMQKSKPNTKHPDMPINLIEIIDDVESSIVESKLDSEKLVSKYHKTDTNNHFDNNNVSVDKNTTLSNIVSMDNEIHNTSVSNMKEIGQIDNYINNDIVECVENETFDLDRSEMNTEDQYNTQHCLSISQSANKYQLVPYGDYKKIVSYNDTLAINTVPFISSSNKIMDRELRTKIDDECNPNTNCEENNIAKSLQVGKRTYPILSHISTWNNDHSYNKIFSSNTRSQQSFNYTKNNPKDRTNKTNTIYTKKYSYRATKIDICEENTPKHQVHIIKKIRVDLDITEITSEKTHVQKNDKEEFVETSLGNNYFENNARNLEGENNKSKKQFTDTSLQSNHFENYNDIHFENYNNIQALKHVNNKQTDGTEGINYVILENSINKCDKRKKEFTEIALNVNIEQKKNDNKIEKGRLTKWNIDNINTNAQEIYKENTLPDSKSDNMCSADNDIKNILQKYSKALSRPSTNTKNNDGTNVKANNTIISLDSKPKKPYKISDINRIDVTLPNSIIAEIHRPNVVTPKKVAVSPSENLQTPELICETIATNNEPQLNDNDEDMPDDCQSPISICNLQLEYQDDDFDGDINQAMFNPKTLLQCMSNEEREEIIPPPIEFTDDDCTYSPLQYTTKLNDHGISEIEFDSIDFLEDFESDNNFTSATDPHNIDLMPSKEVETWTLSPEDTNMCNMFHITPAKSFTTVDRKLSVNERPVRNVNFNSRSQKLGQFKFAHKNKLKRKR